MGWKYDCEFKYSAGVGTYNGESEHYLLRACVSPGGRGVNLCGGI
jgi:hypothetical protein